MQSHTEFGAILQTDPQPAPPGMAYPVPRRQNLGIIPGGEWSVAQILTLWERLNAGFGRAMSFGANTAAVGTACVAACVRIDPAPMAKYVASIQDMMARHAATPNRLEDHLRRGGRRADRRGVTRPSHALPFWLRLSVPGDWFPLARMAIPLPHSATRAMPRYAT